MGSIVFTAKSVSLLVGVRLILSTEDTIALY